jgi:hypothetical protein
VPNCLGTTFQLFKRLELGLSVVSHNSLILATNCANLVVRSELDACDGGPVSIFSSSNRCKVCLLVKGKQGAVVESNNQNLS